MQTERGQELKKPTLWLTMLVGQFSQGEKIVAELRRAFPALSTGLLNLVVVVKLEGESQLVMGQEVRAKMQSLEFESISESAQVYRQGQGWPPAKVELAVRRPALVNCDNVAPRKFQFLG